jgi:putative transposase
MDNASIHRKNKIREIVESVAHVVLFLPTYSADLNYIEHDFSALKRSRMHSPPSTTIDKIIRDYCTA